MKRKKIKKKNNNKVSSPFGCNRCFCTAIYLLSCMYRVISSFTSCVSVVPSYRHLSRRASIFYFPSDLTLLLLAVEPMLVLLLRFLFLPLPLPPQFVIVVAVLSMNCFNIYILSYTFSNRTSKFHYKRVIWLMECRKATCIASMRTNTHTRTHNLNGGRKQFNNNKICEPFSKHRTDCTPYLRVITESKLISN